MIFIKPLEILDRACFLTMKKSYDECFKTNNTVSNDESMEYAIDNTAKALEEVVLHKNYNYRKNKMLNEDYLNYDFSKALSYEETISVVYLNMVKYGIGKIQSVLDDETVVKNLAKSFVIERIKYDRKLELEDSLDDAGKFLINAIESYYLKTREV